MASSITKPRRRIPPAPHSPINIYEVSVVSITRKKYTVHAANADEAIKPAAWGTLGYSVVASETEVTNVQRVNPLPPRTRAARLARGGGGV